MKPTRAAVLRRGSLAGLAVLVLTSLLIALMPAPARTQSAPLLRIPNVPWFAGQQVAPNMLLTLDDSGSMTAGYVPDAVGAGSVIVSIAFKSNLNAMYYNPAVTYAAPPNAAGVPYPTSYTAARLNGFDADQGTLNLATGYLPQAEFNPSTTSFVRQRLAPHCVAGPRETCPGVNVEQYTSTEAYWWTYLPGSRAACPAEPTIAEMPGLPVQCFEFGRPTNEAERQNFANWFSFYRTRNLATVSATMIGFFPLPSEYRVGWQALNTCRGFSDDCRGWDRSTRTDARIGVFNDAKRTELWRWLEKLPAVGSTPLRDAVVRAGEYLRESGPRSPYADDLNATSGIQYNACRASYSVVMTDGIWSGFGEAVGNVDGTARSLPDGRTYTPRAPYADNSFGSLADVSFHYWATDLQPGIPNAVRPFMPFQAGLAATDEEYWDPRNDPATWQRMSSIYVSFGLNRSLTDPVQWLGSTFAGTTSPATGYQRFRQGLAQWPPLGGNSRFPAGNVYDLWHSAINSRGAFYAADSPQALVGAFADLRGRIASREEGASAVSSSSLQVQGDSMMYNTSFSSQRWDGTLRAFRIQSDGTPESAPAWSTDQTFNTLRNGSIGSHVVFARGSGGGLVRLQPGKLEALPAARVAELEEQARQLRTSTGGTVGAADLVRWVLGDTSNTALRRRDRLLGDLVNSPPLFEGGRDYGYAVTTWTDTPRIDGRVYAEYVKSKHEPDGTPKRPTVYVGSNDGMLHAFNGTTGAHRWAYMPTPSFARIGARADPAAAHRWYVDGPIVTHDVHDGTRWRTLLVATPGAGARGLFALDVTDPDSPSLLWEWFPADDDIGFITGEPVVARAQDGRWIVATGNGYGSVSNKASLVLLDALAGSVIKKIDVSEQSTTQANGLSSPALLYLAGKRLAFAYAGDLRGRVWRFDLNGTDPSKWALGFGARPLFRATGPDGLAQPITAKLRIASDRQLGRVLLFGTGRLLSQDDPASLAKQSVYGIRDRADALDTAARSDLTAQTILSESDTVRTISSNDTPPDRAGWYLDLDGRESNRGERVTMAVNYMPELTLMTVSTTRPTAAEDPCSSNVTSWLMAMSPFSGRGVPVFSGSGSAGAGLRLDRVLAAPTPIRMGSSGKVKLTLNAGTAGLSQVDLTRGWNPRAAWTQVR